MSITRILLVRHGETDWNRAGQVMGQRPIPLNSLGTRQAEQLVPLLQNHSVHSIYASPVLRAQQTATILGAALSRSIQTEPGLTEIGMGEWEGLYWKDLTQDFNRLNLYVRPDEARPPGGESLREVQTRAVAAIERLREQPEPMTSLFVTHADVIRTIVAHYLNLDLRTIRQVRIDHASLTGLEFRDSLIDLLFLNVAPILSA